MRVSGIKNIDALGLADTKPAKAIAITHGDCGPVVTFQGLLRKGPDGERRVHLEIPRLLGGYEVRLGNGANSELDAMAQPPLDDAPVIVHVDIRSSESLAFIGEHRLEHVLDNEKFQIDYGTYGTARRSLGKFAEMVATLPQPDDANAARGLAASSRSPRTTAHRNPMDRRGRFSCFLSASAARESCSRASDATQDEIKAAMRTWNTISTVQPELYRGSRYFDRQWDESAADLPAIPSPDSDLEDDIPVPKTCRREVDSAVKDQLQFLMTALNMFRGIQTAGTEVTNDAFGYLAVRKLGAQIGIEITWGDSSPLSQKDEERLKSMGGLLNDICAAQLTANATELASEQEAVVPASAFKFPVDKGKQYVQFLYLPSAPSESIAEPEQPQFARKILDKAKGLLHRVKSTSSGTPGTSVQRRSSIASLLSYKSDSSAGSIYSPSLKLGVSPSSFGNDTEIQQGMMSLDLGPAMIGKESTDPALESLKRLFDADDEEALGTVQNAMGNELFVEQARRDMNEWVRQTIQTRPQRRQMMQTLDALLSRTRDWPEKLKCIAVEAMMPPAGPADAQIIVLNKLLRCLPEGSRASAKDIKLLTLLTAAQGNGIAAVGDVFPRFFSQRADRSASDTYRYIESAALFLLAEILPAEAVAATAFTRSNLVDEVSAQMTGLSSEYVDKLSAYRSRAIKALPEADQAIWNQAVNGIVENYFS